jgi:glycosyltransferase involved in cell wall biosynthesis
MNIAIVTPVFRPYLAGMGTVAHSEAVGLAKLGHSVTVLTPLYSGHIAFETAPENFKIRRLPPVFKFGKAAWLPRLVKELAEFDIVHLHYPFIGAVNSVLKAKASSSKPQVVVTYHMDLVGRGWKKYFFKIYNRLTLPRLIREAKKVIFSSWDYVRKSQLKKYIEKDSQKFVEVPFGVEIYDSKAQMGSRAFEELKRKLGLKDGDKLLIFVGGLDKAHYFKGVGVLLEALTKIKTEQVKVLIVGEGDIRPYYERRARELGVADKVIFAGRVSEAELPFYYRLGRGLLLPSVDKSEAYGMVLLEAMAYGLPVIASHLPGVRSVVGEGNERRGFLINPGDKGELAEAIDSLLADADEARKMGERARMWVERERAVDKEIKTLESIFKMC